MPLKTDRPLPQPRLNADLLPKGATPRDLSQPLAGPLREGFEPPKPVASRKLRPEEIPPTDVSGLPLRALFNVAEVTELLGISRPHLYRTVARGDLVAVRIRDRTLFRRNDLVKFLRDLETLPARAAEKKRA